MNLALPAGLAHSAHGNKLMKTPYKFLIGTLALIGLGFHLTWAAAPPGKSVTPSIILQGGSTSTVKWAAPATAPYKVHVFVPKAGNLTSALYRVYPKGKRPGSTTCLGTDILYPCFEVTINQTQHKNAWVQLMLNGKPETQWPFIKDNGYVAAVADNLGQATLLNVSIQIRFEDPALRIGQTYQGGIIFYLDGSGQHGLIAATSDQSTGIQWYNGSYIITGATGYAVGTGQANTDSIINAQGTGSYAAALVDGQKLNGYTDWFLPSLSELDLMYRNIGPGAPAPLTNIGNFSGFEYWSSTEGNDYSAWYQSFGYNYQHSSSKDLMQSVRAVRAF